MWNNKGDEKDDNFLYDSKKTDHKRFSITEELWDKVYLDALKQKRMPILSIELGNGQELIVLAKADWAYVKEYFERYLDLSK